MIAALVVISLFPLVWAIFGSLKESQEMYNYPYRLFPIAPTLNNYTVLFGLSNFIRSFSNTLLTSLATTAVSIAVACLSGYSLTRFTYPGSRLLKRLILDTYMIPSILLILPIYSILTKLGLRDNLVVYAVMVTSTTLPFCVWLMTSYFAGVSTSFEEAGMIDGCTRFQAFYRIVLPQLTPAMIATGIQAFILVMERSDVCQDPAFLGRKPHAVAGDFLHVCSGANLSVGRDSGGYRSCHGAGSGHEYLWCGQAGGGLVRRRREGIKQEPGRRPGKRTRLLAKRCGRADTAAA